MEHSLERTMAMLERTPGALDELLRGLDPAWTEANEGGESWNATEIVAHLCHAERTDWMPRVGHLLAHGESQPFPPFDRLGQRREMEGRTPAQLLDEFRRLRAESLSGLRELKLASCDMDRLGFHPALGSVSLSQLLATWAAHDLTHLHQLARVLAHQYREAVGPWARYLGVLDCDGHSGG